MRLISQVGITRSLYDSMERPLKKRSPSETSLAYINSTDSKESENNAENSSAKRKRYQAAASTDETNDTEDKKSASIHVSSSNRTTDTKEPESTSDYPESGTILNRPIYPEIPVSQDTSLYHGQSDTASNLQELSQGLPFQDNIQNLISRLLSQAGVNQTVSFESLSNEQRNREAFQNVDVSGLERSGMNNNSNNSNAVAPLPLILTQQLIGNTKQASNLLSSLLSNAPLQQNLFMPQSRHEATSDLSQQRHQTYLELQQQEHALSMLHQPPSQQSIFNILQQIQLSQQAQQLQEFMPSPQVFLPRLESTGLSQQTIVGHNETQFAHPTQPIDFMQTARLLEEVAALTRINSGNDANLLQSIQSIVQNMSSPIVQQFLHNVDNNVASATNPRIGNYANVSLSEAATLSHILGRLSQNALGNASRSIEGLELQALQATLAPNLFGSSVLSSHRYGNLPLSQSNVASYPRSVNDEDNSGISLSVPTDIIHLSEYQIVLRQQLEFFTAKDSDAESNIQGRKKRVRVGQIGIRCRHCSNVPMRQRGRGAVYYTTKLSGVYQAAQNMAVSHLSISCSMIPPLIRQNLLDLHNRRDTAGGGKQYWADCCEAIGLYDDDDGIRFKSI